MAQRTRCMTPGGWNNTSKKTSRRRKPPKKPLSKIKKVRREILVKHSQFQPYSNLIKKLDVLLDDLEKFNAGEVNP